MLEIRYGKKIYDRVLFSSLNITFPSKGFVLLYGESGTGKTTILNILGGLEYLDEGNIYYNGEIVKNDELELFRFKHISYLFQDFVLLENESIKENLKAANVLNQKMYSDEELRRFLKKFFLDKSLDEKVKNLSGGEKQRLSLIRCLILNKDILLCDEPTAALDYDNSISLLQSLKEISSTSLVIVVSHNVDLVKKYADYVVSLHDGKLKSIKEDDKNFLEGRKDIKPPFNYLFSLAIQKMKYSKIRIFLISLVYIFVFSIFLLSLSFSQSFESSLKRITGNYFDYNILSIQETIKSEMGNSLVSFTKTQRPNYREIETFIADGDEIKYSLNGILNKGTIYIDDKKADIVFKAASFETNNHQEVYINQRAKELLNRDIKYKLEYSLITFDEHFNKAQDNIYFNFDLEIIDVVEEFDFLLTPVVYYSYQAMEKYFSSYHLKSASILLHSETSLLKRIILAADDEEITNYEFLIITENPERIYDAFLDNEHFSVTSTSLDTKENLRSIFVSLNQLLNIFIFIALIIILILIALGIYSLIVEHQKDIALLRVIGYSLNDIHVIFLIVGEIIILFGMLFSFIIHPLIVDLLNIVINNFVNIDNFLISLGLSPQYILFVLTGFVLGYLVSIFTLSSLSKLKISKILKEGS